MKRILITLLLISLYLPLAAQSQVDVTTTPITVVVPAIKLVTGAGANKVLTSDASGNGTWQAAAGGDSNWTSVEADTIRARDGDGLHLLDDSGTKGIFVEDGGHVGIGTASPSYLFHVNGISKSTTSYATTVNGGTFSSAGIGSMVIRPTSGSENYDLTIDTPATGQTIEIDPNNAGAGVLYLGESGDSDITAIYGNVGIGTTSPASKLHLDAAGGTDGTGSRLDNASVSTTDATPTTIFTLATATNLKYTIRATFSACQDDGSSDAGMGWFFMCKNVAGTVTETADEVEKEVDNSGGDVIVSGTVSGTNYLIQVTGIAAENWNWEATINITAVAH